MKRSRIFLGLTTACLAIAGVVAAKVSHFGGSRSAWYFAPGPAGGCFQTLVGCQYDALQTPICTAHGFRVYTQITPSGNCLNTLTYVNL